MMANLDKKEMKMFDTLMEWWIFDDAGKRILKKDAPPDIVMMNEEYEKLYVH